LLLQNSRCRGLDNLVYVEQKMITVSNGGQPLSGPKIQPDGDLLLEYVEGEMCIDSDNTSKPFSVSIILHCDNTDEVCTSVFFVD